MSMNQPADPGRRAAEFAGTMHPHWKLFLFEGIVLVALGLLALVVPPLATLGVTIVLGWLFLVSGVMGLVATFGMRSAPGFWWSLLSALLGIGAGLALLLRPVSGALSLTIILIAFFIIEGAVTIMYAFEHRAQLSGRWGWMLISGVVDLGLAAMIMAGLPGTAYWAPGVLVGINMIFGGVAIAAIALHARLAPS